MSPRKTHHVVPSPKGGWDSIKGGGEKAIKHFERKQDAVDFTRKISQNKGSELIIHDRKGRIQKSDSHGNDPNLPRDEE